MSISDIILVSRQALLATFLLAAAPLFLGMLVGVVISIFQSITQIQEQSLTFVPKIIVVGLSFLFFGGWMLRFSVKFIISFLANLDRFI